MKKLYIGLIVLCVSVFSSFAQVKYTGLVCNEKGQPLKGVRFFDKNRVVSVAASNDNGKIEILLPKEGAVVKFITPDSEMGFFTVTKDNFKVVVSKNDEQFSLGHNIDCSFKTSTHSIDKVNADVLDIANDVDPTKALFGQLNGVIVMQNQGFNSTPSLNIRGNSTFGNHSPLILIDGFPRDISALSLCEVESISVLKDAAATALYGNRGANGVIIVTTKRGNKGKLSVQTSYKIGMRLPINQPEFVNAYNYAQLYNEALRNDGLTERFSPKEMEAFRSGEFKELYPNVDWQDEIFRDYGINHQFNLAFSGGGNNFRYFSAITYSNEKGLFDHADEMDEYKSQLGLIHLNLRTNIDVDLTETTFIKFGLLARLQENNRPYTSESNIYNAIYSVPAGAFPIKTNNDIFGSNNIYKYNPVAMVGYSGFKKNIDRTLMADLRLEQDLENIAEGLSAGVAISFDNMGTYYETGRRSYQYEVLRPTMEDDGTISNVDREVYGTDSQLIFGSSLSALYMNSVVQGSLNYANYFGNHGVSAALIYDQQSSILKGRNSSRRRQSLIATTSYNYKGKYFIDGVLNYTGSDVMKEGERFELYPALSAAWLLSEEDFLSKSDIVNLLKIRGSYGYSGNDLFEHDLFRQFFKGEGSYRFTQNNVSIGANKEQVLAVEELLYEKSMKIDAGIDFATFDNRLLVTVNAFYDKRKNILVDAKSVISSVIGVELPQICTGEISNKGLETIVAWSEDRGNFKYGVSGNLLVAKNKILENNEGYKPYEYLKKIGRSLGRQYGLEAIGFFTDDNDIQESPLQVFSEVKPGDIKYKDQNGDNIINEFDKVELGFSSLPEVYYGMNINFEYKSIGINALFQGVANRSVYTQTKSVYKPFVDNSNISTFYTEKNVRWTPENKEGANLPRLTTEDNLNNYQKNSLWIKKGDFLKLRSVELYCNIPKAWVKFMDFKIFVRGNNLMTIDSMDYSDPEAFGVGYPATKSYWLGMNINF